MVVPVPCRLELLLKLLIRMFPWTSEPELFGTRAMPYGFTSPLAGTVEAMTEMPGWLLKRGPWAWAESAPATTRDAAQAQIFSCDKFMTILLWRCLPN